MAKQFPKVNTSRGAPMGRPTSPLSPGKKNIRLFKVRLDSGGYDDGGAYWGFPDNLWCAQCPEGGQMFTRASNRLVAAAQLRLPNSMLARGVCEDKVAAYFRSWCEGRLPPSLMKDINWLWYFDQNNCRVKQFPKGE